jgi:hypothetical protein
MTKYLLLKHYRGAPAPVNDLPMDQWTPEEYSAHVRYMQDFAVRLEGTGEFVDGQALSPWDNAEHRHTSARRHRSWPSTRAGSGCRQRPRTPQLAALPVLSYLLPDLAGSDLPGFPRVTIPLLEVNATVAA